jgi:anti-sigma regulatory factor (Ser/Thr protein kinase)
MPLRLPALALDVDADAESLRRARAWVRDVFERLDRGDLVDAAEVGVSELVTNAVLHGAPPISIQVRGTFQHPRVEVQDGSPRPPAMTFDATDGDQLLATYGRGLGLVAMLSTAWGADLTPDGKVVWFVPVAEPRLEGDLSGEVFDLAHALQGEPANNGRPSSLTRIRILGLPVAPWARFRQRYFELARELRLVSLTPSESYLAARRFSAVFLQAERLGQQIQGLDRLYAALAQHRDVVDLDLFVPPRLPDTMRRLLDTLDQVDELCRQEHMLTLAASSAEQQLIRWWFTEFVRQGAGDDPTSWPDYLRTQGHAPDTMPVPLH